MNRKLLGLLAGAITFSFAIAPSVAQAQLGQSPPGQIQKQRKFAGVEITETQRTQIKEIHHNAQSQIEGILTSEQRRQLEASREGGQKGRTAFADMNLSLEQKSRIQSIMRSAKTRTDAILTPEQRQQVQRNMEPRRQQRQN